MKDLREKIVLVTGGGSGIGRLFCVEFARAGAHIVVWDIRHALMDETKKAVAEAAPSAKCVCYEVDVTNRAVVYETARKVRAEVGKVDVLVNNAGVVTGRRLLECPDDLVEKTMQVNVISHFWTLKAFLPEMLETNCGHVVTIASAAGLNGVAGLVDYCASKFGAVGLDESLRAELQRLGKTGVKTTCVMPYYIDTGMFDGARTRFPWLLPILKPTYVSERVVSAVQNDQAYLAMPRLIWWSAFVRAILPVWLFDYVQRFLGISRSMDHFKGRGDAWARGAEEKKE